LAIIVDKEQKRRDIALSCKMLILEKGINNITVSEAAKTAGIGKGTVYEYFKNKDEIVFELVNILMLEHSKKLKEQLEKKNSTKEKMRAFSTFFYSQEEKELRSLYKEFISLSLSMPKSEMMEFHAQCTQSYFGWFEEILKEGVKKGELKPQVLQLAKGLFVVGEGMFVQNSVIGKEGNIEEDLNNFIDAVFTLLELQ